MDATMPDRGLPLSLWGIWWNAILLLRPAFSRLRTFMWFVTAVAGLTVRVELLGVTSIVRALNLRPSLYTKLLDHFHSSGIELDRLSALWARAVLGLFPSPVRINGRLVLVGDGIKAPKRGKKMPAVKLLHQQSESNTKPEYIMGHSMQAIGVLVHAAKSVFSVPLAVRIHEGLVWSNRDKRTLLDKMLGLLEQGNHLVTRVKANAVAYAPAPRKKGRKTRGRPKTYGKKIKLKSLLANVDSMQRVASPVYGEHNVTLRYRVCDLLWRPAGRLVRFVVVVHPTRGSCILMCTDTSLSAADIIRLYGLRFKIECSFKQAVRQIGSFSYHFWMKDMIPLRYHNGNQYPIANRSTTATVSNAKCAPTMPSSRLAWSPRDCSSISPSPHPNLFGVRLGLGCAPFVPTSRHRSLSWQKRCARHFPNISWVLQKAIPSRNSSPSGRTCKTCQFSAWLRKQKQGLLSINDLCQKC